MTPSAILIVAGHATSQGVGAIVTVPSTGLRSVNFTIVAPPHIVISMNAANQR